MFQELSGGGNYGLSSANREKGSNANDTQKIGTVRKPFSRFVKFCTLFKIVFCYVYILLVGVKIVLNCIKMKKIFFPPDFRAKVYFHK